MHKLKCFSLFYFITFLCFAQDSDNQVKQRILKEYGNVNQYQRVINAQNERQIKIKLKSYQKRLKEPLIENPSAFERLNVIDKERYIKNRKELREKMSAYILKHHHLLEEEKQQEILAEKKKKELVKKGPKTIELPSSLLDNNEVASEELKKSLKEFKTLDQNMFTNLLGKDSKNKMIDLLKNNLFSDMSEEEISRMILVRTEGKPLGRWLRNNPRVLLCLTQVLKDDKALSSLVDILNHPKTLKKYFFISLFVIFVFMFINLKLSTKSIIKKIFFKVATSLGAVGVNLFIFYLLFKEQLEPTVSIIKRHF